jgi:hypothetical protein
MQEQITHAVSAFLAGAAFYWRLESPQKRWTVERALFLTASATSMLWNIGAMLVP